MHQLRVVGFRLLVAPLRLQQPSVEFGVFKGHEDLTRLNAIAFRDQNFAHASADFGAHADVACLQRAGCGKRISAAVPPRACADAHQYDCYQDRYEDFFLHKTFSLLLHHKPFSFPDKSECGPFRAAMPHHTTSKVLSIQAERSVALPTAQIARVPNMACWKMRASSSGARSVRISPSFWPRSMIVAMLWRPSSKFFWKTSRKRLVLSTTESRLRNIIWLRAGPAARSCAMLIKIGRMLGASFACSAAFLITPTCRSASLVRIASLEGK